MVKQKSAEDAAFAKDVNRPVGSNNSTIWAGAAITTAVLAADDATGVGVVDDVAIPFVWIGAAGMVGYNNLKTQTCQYRLVANSSGKYPVYLRGFRDPVSSIYLNAGDTWKIGTTSQYQPGTNNQWRYSASQLRNWGVSFSIQYEGNRGSALVSEAIQLGAYFNRNGSLPPGNKIFR